MSGQMTKALAGGTAQGFQGTHQISNLNCDADEPTWKAKARIGAELALRGYGLSELSDGSYLIHKWNLSKHVADLRGASCFLGLLTRGCR